MGREITTPPANIKIIGAVNESQVANTCIHNDVAALKNINVVAIILKYIAYTKTRFEE